MFFCWFLGWSKNVFGLELRCIIHPVAQLDSNWKQLRTDPDEEKRLLSREVDASQFCWNVALCTVLILDLHQDWTLSLLGPMITFVLFGDLFHITFKYLLEIVFPVVGWCETLGHLPTRVCGPGHPFLASNSGGLVKQVPGRNLAGNEAWNC